MKFGVSQPDVFATWLHSLTLVRNTVAHHGRLLRHKFVAGPQNLSEKRIKLKDAHSFYSAATVMNVLLSETGLPNRWKSDLLTTFETYPGVQIREIGFPPNWIDEPGW